jgi:hypothetical protein
VRAIFELVQDQALFWARPKPGHVRARAGSKEGRYFGVSELEAVARSSRLSPKSQSVQVLAQFHPTRESIHRAVFCELL